MFVPYDPKRFVVIKQETDPILWMKRQLDKNPKLRDSLFIYRAAETESLFLAEWFIENSLFVPLMEIGPGLSSFNKVTAKRFLREIVKPPETRDHLLALQKAESDHDKEKEAFDARRIENKAKMLRDYTDIKPAGDGSVFLPHSIQRH